VTVNLNTMEPGKTLDQWFPLVSGQHKPDMGSVRITAKFCVSPNRQKFTRIEILGWLYFSCKEKKNKKKLQN